MRDQNILNKLKCAFPSNNEHFLKQPIKLVNCEHSVCKQCIQNKDKIQIIECNVCKTISKLNSIDVQLLKDTQDLVAKNFLDTLKVLDSKSKPKLEHLRSIKVQ
jgi:S-adenosylmethionine:diacylglycerol 3-amino-3-carboxypropyl transferase